MIENEQSNPNYQANILNTFRHIWRVNIYLTSGEHYLLSGFTHPSSIFFSDTYRALSQCTLTTNQKLQFSAPYENYEIFINSHDILYIEFPSIAPMLNQTAELIDARIMAKIAIADTNTPIPTNCDNADHININKQSAKLGTNLKPKFYEEDIGQMLLDNAIIKLHTPNAELSKTDIAALQQHLDESSNTITRLQALI